MIETSLPKKHHYTLQQAVDTLNKHFTSQPDQPVIDIEYLLHIGANNYIPLYFHSSKEIEVHAYPDNSIVNKTLSYAGHVLCGNRMINSFLLIDSQKIAEIEMNGTTTVYSSTELLIKNIGKLPNLLGAALGPNSTDLQNKYVGHPFLPVSEILYRAAKQYDENLEKWFFSFKQSVIDPDPDQLIGQELNKESLYIFADDLEALKDQNHKELKNKIDCFDIEQEKPFLAIDSMSKKERIRQSILIVLVELGYLDFHKLPNKKNGSSGVRKKVFEYLNNHGDPFTQAAVQKPETFNAAWQSLRNDGTLKSM